MIIFGNSDTLCTSHKGKVVWKPILDYLRASGSVLPGLPSFCQLHPTDVCLLTTRDEFRHFRPNGGCREQCTARLTCGHSCPQRCHSIDRNHVSVKCFEPCTRFPPDCPNEHKCPKLCWQACGSCDEQMEAHLACGHTEMTTCHVASSQLKSAQLKCSTEVPTRIKACGHDVTISCYSASTANPFCPHNCTQALPCGHTCGRLQCGVCHLNKNHEVSRAFLIDTVCAFCFLSAAVLHCCLFLLNSNQSVPSQNELFQLFIS